MMFADGGWWKVVQILSLALIYCSLFSLTRHPLSVLFPIFARLRPINKTTLRHQDELASKLQSEFLIWNVVAPINSLVEGTNKALLLRGGIAIKLPSRLTGLLAKIRTQVTQESSPRECLPQKHHHPVALCN